MSYTEPPRTDPLRAFLWGKRQSQRHALAIDVDIKGVYGTLEAHTVDLSATGLLMRVPESALKPESAEAGEVDPFVLVQTHFRNPFAIRLRQSGVRAQVELVRLDIRLDEPGYLFLGCRFSRPLVRSQLRKFGLSVDEVKAEAHALPSDMVPLRAGPKRLLTRIREVDTQDALCDGKVLGIGEGTLCAKVAHGDAAEVANRLRHRRLTADVLLDGEVLWSTGARLQAIGFLDDTPDALELGLIVDTEPDPKLKLRFKLRRSD